MQKHFATMQSSEKTSLSFVWPIESEYMYCHDSREHQAALPQLKVEPDQAVWISRLDVPLTLTDQCLELLGILLVQGDLDTAVGRDRDERHSPDLGKARRAAISDAMLPLEDIFGDYSMYKTLFDTI